MSANPPPQPPEPSASRAAPPGRDRPAASGLDIGFVAVALLVLGLVTRGAGVVGIAVLFLIFVPMEKLFAFRPQKVLRRGFLTDLTHLLVNNVLITVGALVSVVAATIPFVWLRHVAVAGCLSPVAAVMIAATIVFVGHDWAPRPAPQ